MTYIENNNLLKIKLFIRSIIVKFKILNSALSIYRRSQFYRQRKLQNKYLRRERGLECTHGVSSCPNVLRDKSVSCTKIKAIWLGADPNQDKIGFLEELDDVVELTIFKNHLGQKCLYYQRNDPDVALRNSINLLDLLKKVECEIVIGQFWPELIDLNYAELRATLDHRKIKVICIAMDDFMPERWLPKGNGKIAGPAGYGSQVSLYATSDLSSVQRYYKLGLSATYLPFGCSLNIRRNNVERDIDVLFVGSNYGRRGDIIDNLKRNGIPLTTYGPGFELGRIDADEIISLYSRAKIVLGLCNVGYQKNEVNLKTRDFDSISCGALLISNSCAEFNFGMTPGRHYVQFFEIRDLLIKIKYYLSNPIKSREIAECGYVNGLKYHLWREHLRKVIYEIP